MYMRLIIFHVDEAPTREVEPCLPSSDDLFDLEWLQLQEKRLSVPCPPPRG